MSLPLFIRYMPSIPTWTIVPLIFTRFLGVFDYFAHYKLIKLVTCILKILRAFSVKCFTGCSLIIILQLATRITFCWTIAMYI